MSEDQTPYRFITIDRARPGSQDDTVVVEATTDGKGVKVERALRVIAGGKSTSGDR